MNDVQPRSGRIANIQSQSTTIVVQVQCFGCISCDQSECISLSGWCTTSGNFRIVAVTKLPGNRVCPGSTTNRVDTFATGKHIVARSAIEEIAATSADKDVIVRVAVEGNSSRRFVNQLVGSVPTMNLDRDGRLNGVHFIDRHPQTVRS